VKNVKSTEELHKEEWPAQLYNYLSTLSKSISPQVNLVFGDLSHSDLVLNWLNAALEQVEPPLHNIMVLSLDHDLCELLQGRALPLMCLAVPTDSLYGFHNKKKSWTRGVVVHPVILRLINYWGYDVASYDSDAVLIKNPQVLYDRQPHVHFFSAPGVYPQGVASKWGFAVCGGTQMLRASPAIGETQSMGS
jgi:hypothetical protein